MQTFLDLCIRVAVVITIQSRHVFLLHSYLLCAILSIIFQVMVQRHNRHMSFSLYISALAVNDTIALLIGECLAKTITLVHKK